MRNLKKVLSVLLVVAMLATSMVTAFAADTISADAKICADIGMLIGAGDGVTSEYTATTPSRIQAAVMLLRLKGKAAEAAKFEGKENFADVEGDEWFAPYTAYLKANPSVGFVGVEDGKFAAEEKITAQQYYKVVLTALGYEVGEGKDYKYEDTITFAASKGLKLVADVKEFTVNDIAIATVEGLKATVKGGSKTLVASLVDAKAIDLAKAQAAGLMPVPAAVDVKSVTSLSNNKIKVVLNAAASSVKATDFAVVDSASAVVEVKSISATTDYKTVYVSTADMTPGAKYTLTAGGKSFDFVSNIAKTDKLTVNSTATAKNNVEVEVTFSANVDPVVAANPANYTVDNNLTVSAVTVSGAKVVLATSAQTAGTLYKITVANVTDELGNALDTAKNIAYFGGVAADTNAPTASASSDTNTRFKIAYADNSDLDEASVLNTANYAIDGGLTITSIAYEKNADGTANKKAILLTTSAQTAGTLYTVTLNNIADKFSNKITANTKVYFGGRAADTSAPTISGASSVSNTSVKVTFADLSNMDETSVLAVANYAIDGSLAISAVKYDAATKSATLTTSAQTAGTLYKVTVNNVKDEYNNAITANSTVYFGGKAIDSSAPTYTAVATANNKVKVTFSDNIDAATAIGLNFSVKNLGYALSVSKVDDKNFEITTLGQTSGVVYTLEARNVKNTDGTAVASDSKTTFAGMGTVSTSAPKLLAAYALDNKSVVLSFDKALAVLPTTVAVTDNADSAFDSTTGIAFYNGTTTQVVAYLSTKTFADGTLYKAVASGAIATNGIAISTSENYKATFAGISTAPVAAKVLAAVSVDNSTVKVIFDKPVAVAADVAGSVYLMASDKTTAVKYADTTDVKGQIKDISSDGKELTIYFAKTGTTLSLTEGVIYTVKFTDLTKVTTKGTNPVINLKADTDKDFATIQFSAVKDAPAKPKLVAAVAVSKYVVDLVFDKAIAIAEDAATIESKIVIKPYATNNVMPVVKLAKVDGKNVRLFLDETAVGTTDLVEGYVYTIKYTPDATNYISDKVDTSLTVDLGTAAYKEVSFAAYGTAAKGPAVTAVANTNANTVNVTLDQVATSPAIELKKGTTVVNSAYYNVIPASDNKSFKIVLNGQTDAAYAVFEAGVTYSVSLKDTTLDESGLRKSDPAVVTTFGGIANKDLVLVGLVTGGTVSATLTDSKGDALATAKDLRLRVIVDKKDTTKGEAVTTVATAVASSASASWALTGNQAGEQFLIEATDGTVAITVVNP